MGKRGPPRKPSGRKKLEGTYRKDRAPEHEVQPAAGYPSCPSSLDAEAKREWRRLQGALEPLGYITAADRGHLEAYCRNHSLIRQYAEQIRTAGPELAIAKGYVNALVKLQTQNDRLAAKLGLTPSDRASLKVDGPKPADPVEEYLHRRRGMRVVDGGA